LNVKETDGAKEKVGKPTWPITRSLIQTMPRKDR
jgi:hypothetical protein